jgi:gluconate 2-dehydrogenase gamma chain
MSNASHAYQYLPGPEARFLDAAVARLIPADDLGPGAKEADVT